MNKKFLLILICISIIASVPGFSLGRSEIADSDAVNVFVSILPQTYFIEKIGGERVLVNVMVPPGRSPTTYEPTPNQVTALSRAVIFFTIGMPFENAFIPRIAPSLKSLKIVDTATGIKKRYLAAHIHEDDGEAEHNEGESVDPHIWLSPVLAKQQAQNIYNALVEADPDGRSVYDEGLQALIKELEKLDAEIRTVLAPRAGSTVFIYHPTLGYFTDEYNLHQISIETGGKEPTPVELENIIRLAREKAVKVIFVQPEFSGKSARIIAGAIGGSVVVVNPLNPDYINSLKEIADKIRQSYQ